MWTSLGTVDPSALVDARLSAHWACQVPAAAAASLLPHREDYGHTNLGWDRATRSLLSRALGDDDAVYAGLRLSDLAWVVVQGGAVVRAQSVAGQTLAQGCAWMAAALAEVLGRAVSPFALFEHDMPAHAVQDGAAFDISGQDDARAELEHWIANTHAVLERFVRDDATASEVRLWPHHFDQASLLTLVPHEDAEQAKSVNVGFSYGDGSYVEPYGYVSPWPYPAERTSMPALVHGS